MLKGPWSTTGSIKLFQCKPKILYKMERKMNIVSRSRTMHPQSPALTSDGTVLKESDDLVILGVTIDSKMTFEKHIHSVSRAAAQRLGILRNS